MKISAVLAATVALCVTNTTAQSQQDKTLTGTVTIKSNGRTTAVHGKSADKTQGEFLFCIDQDRSASPQSIAFSGPAKVVYRPMPGPDLPEGVVISGPESVASTLAVIAQDGKAWLFTRKGEPPVLPSGDPALAKATRVNVNLVRRTDWAPAGGRRRGTDIEGCLAPGG